MMMVMDGWVGSGSGAHAVLQVEGVRCWEVSWALGTPVALWWEAALQIRDSGEWQLPQCGAAAPFQNPNPVNVALPVGRGGAARWGLDPHLGEMGCLLCSSQIISLSKNTDTAAMWQDHRLIRSITGALNFEERPARSSSLKIVR